MKIKINQQFLSILLIIILTNCSLNMNMQAKPAKIIFNISDINAQGLRGNETSMRSVSYEFCIPTDKDIARKIKKLIPALSFILELEDELIVMLLKPLLLATLTNHNGRRYY